MQELQLSGVVGLVVANEFVMTELPPKILNEIQEFAANGLPGQCLELGKKQPLTSMEVWSPSNQHPPRPLTSFVTFKCLLPFVDIEASRPQVRGGARP
jgi:hypothetical protein